MRAVSDVDSGGAMGGVSRGHSAGWPLTFLLRNFSRLHSVEWITMAHRQGGTAMTQSLLVSLLVVFFGSATVAVARARQIVSIADNAVLTSPGASIDFPAVDVRLVSEVSLLGKTTGIGVNIFVKLSTVLGVFGDSVPLLLQFREDQGVSSILWLG